MVLGRRNLTPIQRISVTEKYRPIYEKQARENSLSNLKQNPDVVILPTRNNNDKNIGRTSEKLASIAGVSEKTYRMGAKVLQSDNEDLKNKVLSGNMSISAGYKKIIKPKEIINKTTLINKENSTITESKIMTTEKSIWTHRMHLLEAQKRSWLKWLMLGQEQWRGIK